MPKKRKATKSKARRGGYRAETYGIKFDSLTFLVLAVFVLIAAVALVSQLGLF